MTTKVFSYDCKHPKFDDAAANLALIDQQVSLAHKFYNKLVELHREQYDRTEAVRRALFPDLEAIEQAVADADAKVDEIVEAIRKANSRAKSKRATPEEAEQLANAKQARKDAWAKRKEVRVAIAGNAELQTSLAAIYAEFQGVVPPGKVNRQGGKLKDAAATSGVYWGTKAKVFSAIDDAQKKTIGPIRFKAWDGDGQIAVQIVGGCTWLEMLQGIGAASGKIQATPIPRLSKRRPPMYRFRIRVQSDGDAENCFAEFAAYLHRPLPDDARITWVSLVRHRLAPKRMHDGHWHQQYEWSIQLTCEFAESVQRAPRGVCGVDLGWRIMDDGSLRVAYVVGDDGYIDDVRLPADLLSRWSKAQSLQGIRDRNFNAVIEKLADWKASLTVVPEWLAECTKFMTAWHAKGKLVRVIHAMEANAVAEYADMLAMLHAWREQDTHLWQWAVESVKQSERIRKDTYRKFAYKLSHRLATIIVEDCDWRQLRKKKQADDNDNDTAMREYMNAASVGMLRALLEQVGAKMSDAKDTTRRCHACGHLCEWNQIEVWHTCESCSLPWDQDYNAAANLHASGLALAKEAESLADTTPAASSDCVESPKKLGKWEKRKAARSQKRAESDKIT